MRKLFSVLSLLSIQSVAMAQDVHFSNLEMAPQELNVGLIGLEAPIKAIINYRSQWKSVASPYKTANVSVEALLNAKKTRRSGDIALGLNFYNDQVGRNTLKTNNVKLSLAYHLHLNRAHKLGLGIYAGYVTRSLTMNEAQWGSQYNGMDYDPTISSGESLNNRSYGFFDTGAGLVYSYKDQSGYMTQNNQREMTAGFAVYHVNKPNNSFINDGEHKLPMRWTLHANALIGIQNTKGSVLPGLYVLGQGKFYEVQYGLNYRYMLKEGSQITGFNRGVFGYIGLFHRWNDALLVKAAVEWGDFMLGGSYDVNISKLISVSTARGGFELYLRYNFSNTTQMRSKWR